MCEPVSREPVDEATVVGTGTGATPVSPFGVHGEGLHSLRTRLRLVVRTRSTAVWEGVEVTDGIGPFTDDESGPAPSIV